MVDINRGDHGVVGIEHIDCIQPSAKADLQHPVFNTRFGKGHECCQGAKLEVSKADFAPGAFYFFESLDQGGDRKSTRLNSSHVRISYAVFCLKKKKKQREDNTLPAP